MARFLCDLVARAVGQVFGHDDTVEGRLGRRLPFERGATPGVEVRRVDRFVLVRLEALEAGDEDKVVERLRASLTSLLEEGYVRHVLDLSGLDQCSAALVTYLVGHHRRIGKREGTFRIHGVGPRLASSLGQCGLLDVLELYETEEEALEGRYGPNPRR
jgi:anti-anti-sigma factor